MSSDPQTQPSPGIPTLSNLQQRWLTALTLGPLILAMIFLGGISFYILAAGLALVAVLEFCALGHRRNLYASPLVASAAAIALLLAVGVGRVDWMLVITAAAFVLTTVVSIVNRRQQRALLDGAMTLAALAYIGVPAGLAVRIREASDGLILLLLIVSITWGTDVFAFFVGRSWGKTPLAPHISPKKTVEGAIGGLLGGASVGLLLLLLTNHLTPASAAVAVVGPFVAILGDLTESALKRAFAVKDSHLSHLNLFPGHGGVLDRIDSLILVIWFCYAAYSLFGFV